MTNVLEVRKLSAGYGPLRVLHEIDLAVVAGERVGLVGPAARIANQGPSTP